MPPSRSLKLVSYRLQLLKKMEDYLKNLAETDMVLAPVHVDEPAETEGAAALPEWKLPCHSLILTAHSKSFAVSAHASEKAGNSSDSVFLVASLKFEALPAEPTKNGKKILRLPLSEQAARSFLQHLYGCLGDGKGMGLSEACQLAALSHQAGLQNGDVLSLRAQISILESQCRRMAECQVSRETL